MKKIKLIFLLQFLFALVCKGQVNFEYSDSVKWAVEASISYGETEKAHKTLLMLKKKDAEFYFLMGSIYYAKQKFELAEESFLQAVNMKRKTALYELSKSYSLQNDFENAALFLEKYLSTRNKKLLSEVKTDSAFAQFKESVEWGSLFKKDFYSKYELSLNDAQYYFSNDKYNDAFEVLDNLIYKKKNKYNAYLLRYQIHLHLGSYKPALQDLKMVIKLQPKNIEYKFCLAELYFIQKKYRKSLKVLTKIENGFEIHDPKFFKLKANNYFLLKKYDDANVSISAYLNFYYKSIQAKFLLAQILSAQEDFLAALPVYSKCVEAYPKNPDYLYARANAYYLSGTYSYAEKDLLLALDYKPNNAGIYYLKGFVRLAQGDKNGAKADWNKAYKLGLYKAADAIEENRLK